MNTENSRQPCSVWVLFNPILTVLGIWKRRYLIVPLLMLVIYTFVFSVIFKARWRADFGDSKIAFALIIFCGISAFNIFSESINGSAGVITGNPNYVKKVVFSLEILPVSEPTLANSLGKLEYEYINKIKRGGNVTTYRSR